MIELKIGQIWKDRRNNPNSLLIITDIYVKHYRDDYKPLRVKGLVISSNIEWYEKPIYPGDELDWDARSVRNNFRYLMFDPVIFPDTENKIMRL